MSDQLKKIVVIGNGIAGITAARHIRKYSDHEITVISSESKHFWSRTALMYIYMGHMKYEHTKPYEDNFWSKNRIELIHDHVDEIDAQNRTLKLASDRSVPYTELILATGAIPNKFGWEGQDLKGVTGMVSLQDLERIEEYSRDTHHAVIVGGGLIGIEMAEMLRSRNIDVTFLIREAFFWSNILPKEEARLISQHITEHHVDLRLETELERILSDENGRVKGIVTKKGEEISCTFVGLAVGVSPNISLAKNSGIPVDKGILVNEYLETGIPGIYAIGDCAQRTNELTGRKSIEQVWYTGRMMGETLALTITGQNTPYQPGPWFNSAKFFDIEYQTYGNVPPEIEDHLEDFYWENTEKNKALHIVFEKSTKRFVGINTFGLRMRHEHFDRWLRQKAKIDLVMQNFHKAGFDPEFFQDYNGDILSDFNAQFPSLEIKIPRKKVLGIF